MNHTSNTSQTVILLKMSAPMNLIYLSQRANSGNGIAAFKLIEENMSGFLMKRKIICFPIILTLFLTYCYIYLFFNSPLGNI